jgi:hypothetical protein
MNRKLEEKIRKEIRKHAFERSDRLWQEKQHLQSTKHTLDALHEVTGLPRPELEAISNEVLLSFKVSRDEFFSIRNQILVAFGVSGFVTILGCLLFMI